MSDRPELNELLNRLRPALLAWAEAQTPEKLRAKLDPGDLVQHTLLEFLQNPDKLLGRPDHEVLAWLRRALSNNMIDAARKYGGARAEVSPQLLGESSSGLADWLAAPDTSPSERAVRNERFERLASSLARLPDAQRIAVELRFLRNLKIAQIASMLERSEGAVALLLHRAIGTMRVELAEPPDEP